MIKIIVNHTSDEHEDAVNEELALGNTIQSVNVAAAGDKLSLVTVVNLIAHKLSYDENGGTGSIESQDGPEVVVKGSTGLTPPAGKAFARWNTKDDGTGADYVAGQTIKLTKDIVLYAIWVNAVVGEHTLSYDANTGTGTLNSQTGTSAIVKSSEGIEPPTGKVFSKWNTQADGDGDDYEPGEVVALADDIALYAIWVDVSFELSYDANTGTGTIASQSGASVVVKNSTGLTAPANKAFSKWNTKADGTGTDYAPGDVIDLTDDLKLYAVWVDD